MDVLTSAKMKLVDADTIKRHLPGIELMERAGRQVADFILDRFPPENFKASIFVGPGNNGGDALVVARLLIDEGRACSMHYLKPTDNFTIDALKNYERLKKRSSNRNLVEINSTRPDWANIIRKDLLDSTIIIDGLFGTGITRDLSGRTAEIVDIINGTDLPVVAIDTPSGIHGDTGEVLGIAVRADYTVTMGYPKLGLLFYPGKQFVGELLVADLGFPEEVLQVHSLGLYLLDRPEAAKRLPFRPPDTHKYRCGTVTIIAGSRQYTGAASLTAEAALRSGCGMVYVAVPESVRSLVEGSLREAITFPVPETSSGTTAAEALDLITPYIERSDALIIGPGIGRHEETADVVRTLCRQSTIPVVLDADGLSAFDSRPEDLSSISAPRVLTPHSGELARLIGQTPPDQPLERVELTRRVAKECGSTLVHKGAPTIIASPEGEAWVLHHGNSALATAGTGDVLTGLIGGLIAQGASSLDGACVGCAIHGLAAEQASQFLGVRGVIAGDLFDYLGDVISDVERMAPAQTGP